MEANFILTIIEWIKKLKNIIFKNNNNENKKIINQNRNSNITEGINQSGNSNILIIDNKLENNINNKEKNEKFNEIDVDKVNEFRKLLMQYKTMILSDEDDYDRIKQTISEKTPIIKELCVFANISLDYERVRPIKYKFNILDEITTPSMLKRDGIDLLEVTTNKIDQLIGFIKENV